MFQYYIVEIQKSHSGEYAHIVHYAFDTAADTARLKAEAQYHTVMAAAAVSDTAMHSATLISAEGVPLLNQCYKHAAAAPTAPVEE